MNKGICRYFSFQLFLLTVLFAFASRAQEQRPSADQLGDDRRMAAMHSISSHVLLDYVKELCSSKYQGRLTGTPGYAAAADWAIRLLGDWKIKPGGDQGTYLQSFPNPYTLVLPGAELTLHIPTAGQGKSKSPIPLRRTISQARLPTRGR